MEETVFFYVQSAPLAMTSPMTDEAPALFNSRAASCIVAPVV